MLPNQKELGELLPIKQNPVRLGDIVAAQSKRAVLDYVVLLLPNKKTVLVVAAQSTRHLSVKLIVLLAREKCVMLDYVASLLPNQKEPS